MSNAGWLARVTLIKEQLKNKPCAHCRQLYDPTKLKKCPHCGDLDQAGLMHYIKQIERERLGNRKLGMWFFTAMLVVGFIMLIVASA